MAVRQPVALVHVNGTVATVLAVNVSLGGLRVVCDRYTLDALFPGGNGPHGPVGTPMDVHFKLPLAHGMAKLDLSCRVAYVTRADRGSWLVGLEFTSAAGRGHEALRLFLEEALAIDQA